MRKYVVEFIGTFFFVLTIVMTVATTAGTNNFLAPLAIGSALMIMVYAGGHISGGHYNPAVTLAVWIRGKCDTSDVLPYIVAQVIGAALATLVAAPMLGFKGVDISGIPAFDNPIVPILAEFLGTFALAYVVLNTATAKGTSGNSFYGLAIGFTVTVMAYALGGISGGAFNPAVGVGITMSGLSAMSNLLVYVFACLAGGAAAAFVFKFVNDPTDR